MKTIEDLRESLFDTLDKVKNSEINNDTATIICDISKVIIDSARAEIELVRTIGAIQGSGFIKIENNK